MLFNSAHFIVFFPIVILVYYVLPQRGRYLWLLAASYYFYMSWNPKYIVLLLFSTAVTYASGRLLAAAKNTTRRKLIVAASFILNLGVLFYFKYVGMAADILVRVLGKLHIYLTIPSFDVVLPLTVGDELVAGADESRHEALAVGQRDIFSVIEQARVGVVARRQPLHLATDAVESAATINVMIDTLGGGQHIHDLHQRVDTTGKAGGYNGIRMMFLNEAHSTYGSIDLANAALPKDYLVISQTTAVATDGVVHLTILDVHRYNNSYLHVLLVSIFVSVFYRAKIVLFSLMDALDIIFLFNKRYDKQLQ